MKNISLLIIGISLSTLLQAQLLTNDQRKVRQTIVNFFESLSNRDSVSLKNYSTADILLFEYGQVWNLDTLIRKAIQQNTATDFKRINTIDFMTSSVDNNTAWATYQLRSEITREGKQVTIHWIETVILVREKKNWKLKVLHSTRIGRT